MRSKIGPFPVTRWVAQRRANPALFLSSTKVSVSAYVTFWLQKELKESQCLSVCPPGTALVRALNPTQISKMFSLRNCSALELSQISLSTLSLVLALNYFYF